MRDPHKQGKVYKYKDLIFWAQGGVICIEDSRDNSFTAITVDEFKFRILTVGEIYNKSRHRYSDERNEDLNFIINGCACRKEAKSQGDPFDPEVIAYLNRHRRKSYIFDSNGRAVSHSGAVHHEHVPEGALLHPIPTAPESKPAQKIIV